MRLISATLAVALLAGPAVAQTAPAGPVLPQGEALTAAIRARVSSSAMPGRSIRRRRGWVMGRV